MSVSVSVCVSVSVSVFACYRALTSHGEQLCVGDDALNEAVGATSPPLSRYQMCVHYPTNHRDSGDEDPRGQDARRLWLLRGTGDLQIRPEGETHMRPKYPKWPKNEVSGTLSMILVPRSQRVWVQGVWRSKSRWPRGPLSRYCATPFRHQPVRSGSPNKKPCSRQLQCKVPCGVGNVVHSSLFINSSLSSLSSTSCAVYRGWSHLCGVPASGKGGSTSGMGRGSGRGEEGQGTFQSSCHQLHYHMVLRPKGTSHNDPEGLEPQKPSPWRTHSPGQTQRPILRGQAGRTPQNSPLQNVLS